MRRRALLRSAGVALGGGVTTLAGLTLAESAGAQASLSLTATGDEIELGADESLTGATLTADIEWTYAVPETASVTESVVQLAAGADDVVQVAEAVTPQLLAEASGTDSFEVKLLETDALAAAAVTADGTPLTVRATLLVRGADGVLIETQATDTATLTATRTAAATAGVGGTAGVQLDGG